MIRAVLFDLDETLLTRASAIRAFIADQYDRHHEALAAIARDVYIARFLTLEDGGRVAKTSVYPALGTDLAIPPTLSQVLLVDYQAIYPRYATLTDGALETLQALRGQGLKLGVVTNGNAIVQNGKVDATGLRPVFDTVLVSEAEGMSKPDPAFFALALQRLGVTAAEAVFVGDNPRADIEGARKAGLRAVWFHSSTDWPDDLAPPDHTITKMVDLIALLARQGSAFPAT